MQKIDYTKFGTTGPDNSNGAVVKQWWKAPEEEICDAVSGVVKFLSQNDSRRQTQYQISTRLYGNTNLIGLNGLSYSKITSAQGASKDRVSFNVIQSSCDTLVSKLAKNRPQAMFLTSGGNWKQMRRAQKLEKFVDGVFYENNFRQLHNVIRRDYTVFGDGGLHVFAQNDRVKFERVLASELYVDPVESFYGEPRQLHWVKNVDRQVLSELFPEYREAIETASSASADMIGEYQNVADQITVVASWHLPSGKTAKDGVYTVNIAGQCLLKEEYKKPFFPFAFAHWSKRLYGFWGQGAPEQIQNIQLEINKLLWVIQRSMHLAGSFKVLLENGSKIVKEHLNNDIGAIVTYTGTPPSYVLPPVVPMEYYTHLQNLKTMAYEQLGVSQLSANSQKPAGLNSGKALREYNDIETDRFKTTGEMDEDFVLRVTRLAIDVAKDIYKEKGTYSVQVPGRKFLETIDWKDVNLEEDEYVLKMFPVSSLPKDPAGRLQTIQEYIQAGFISPRTGRKLLDFPDLEQIEDLANSTEDYLHMVLEKIVDEGKYTPPEPFDDLQLAKEMVLQYYAQGKRNGLEEDRLEMLRTFNDQVSMLIQKATQPPPQTQTNLGGIGQPQAQPMPPSTSPLIPNVPQAGMQ